MAFKRGGINHRAAAMGAAPGVVNHHLLAALQKLESNVDALEKRSGAQAVDFDRQTPVGDTPGLGTLDVRTVSGRFTVIVTNPEYVIASAGAKRARNPLRTTVLHRIAFSTNAQFDGAGDVRKYGPSAQTHWVIDDIGTSLRFVRLESSFDGDTYNKPVIAGPFQS